MLSHVGTCIADEQLNKPFHILIPNFSENGIDVLPGPVVSYASQHPETIFESDISQGKMLELLPENVDTKYCKRHLDSAGIDTINNYIADQREQNIGKYYKPGNAKDIHLDVSHEMK